MTIKIKPTEYVKPAQPERENPYVEVMEEYVSRGLDTAFEIEFTGDEYKADKGLIQAAVRKLGFSAREVATDYDETKPAAKVTSTFLIRPPRKRKAGETQEEADAAADGE